MNRPTEISVTRSSDKEFASIIQEAIEKNGGYCPCRAAKTEDTKCMCKEFRDQIEAGTPGTCHCGLYEIHVKQQKEQP